MKSGFYFVLKVMGNTDNFKCWKVDRTESWNCEIESRGNKQLAATKEKYKKELERAALMESMVGKIEYIW